jgi:4-amino-4-deoxy-L-arabinose transferase-like glycosyltransferase
MPFRKLLPAIALLWLAFTLRTWDIDRVPPGLHDDEVINNELVEQYVLAGNPQIFYTFGGREGLFHFTFGFSMRFIGYNVLGYRWTGMMWGMIGLAAMYALANRLLGQRPALIALAFAATSFWSMYEGRAATRSVSLIGLAALAALAFLIAWQRNRLRNWLGAGAVLGLTLYTYIAARVVPVIFLMLLAYLALAQRRRMMAAWRGVIVYVITAAVVMTPLIIYLSLNPAIDMRYQMLTGPIEAARSGNFAPVVATSLQTLGMFVWRGDPQWHYNVAGTPVFDPLTSLLFVIGLIITFRRAGKFSYAFYLIWLFFSLVPGMLSDPAPHYMRTANAQISAYTLLGIGGLTAVEWAARRGRRLSQLAWLALAVIWLVATVINLHNFFTVWPADGEVRLYHQANVSDMARYLDQSADTTPVVGCSPFLNEKEDWIRSSRQTMHFVLQRTDLPIRWHDCRDSLVIPQGGQWRQFILYFTPLERNIPLSIRQWYTTTAPIHLSSFDDSALFVVDARDQLDALGIEHPLKLDFDHRVTLLGYRVEKSSLRAGKALNVTTYWQVIDQPPPWLTVFVHVLNGSDQIAAQIDRESVLADTLQPGDVFVQLHSIDLPNDLAPGGYRLSLGLYTSDTNQRLPIFEGNQPIGDHVVLQSITIKP